MGAVYVFVGVAFIVGLLCASLYHNIRNRLKHRGEPESGGALTEVIQRLDRIHRPGELGAALLDELAARLQCKALALYIRDDVDFHLNAGHRIDDVQAEQLRARLESDSSLAAPSPRAARVVRLDDRSEYALVAFVHGRQTGVVTISPIKAVAHEAPRRLVEAAGGYALARLETIRLGQALKEAATRDTVTRLHNQRYFLELFELEFNRSQRYQRALSVLLCGVKDLAALNAREGSETGDVILRQIANAFRDSLRYFDVVGRYESDTLAVLLPEADRDVATGVATRLLLAAGAETGIENLGMSIGVACMGDPGIDYTMLLNAARDALHQAMEEGGNRVCLSPL
ncbi:MAG TPA: GGDEF domain-containing protein [Gammaproteobacteria bacterium]|nr:GGDEF domain-containing protein [Gammaproteobacteria bacterium]